jgi:MFS family permease
MNYAVQPGYGVMGCFQTGWLVTQELNFSRTAGGAIFNSYLIIYIALTPITGYLTDRFGARRVVTACALIPGIGLVLMGTV